MKDLDALSLSDLLEEIVPVARLRTLIATARDEDLGGGNDVTTQSVLAPGRRVTATMRTRETGVIAGLVVVPALLDVFGADVVFAPMTADGERCDAGAALGEFDGDLGAVLLIERTLLNLVGHLSGVASLTRRFVDAVAGCPAVICATRKTLPGLRGLQKYAVRCGGGSVHRLGLFDAALYKDNHLATLDQRDWISRLSSAIDVVRGAASLRFVEVEVDTLEQFDAVLGLRPGQVDLVLLDNMTPSTLRAAVAARDRSASDVGLEASGGISLETVRSVAETNVDRISVGALTHSARGLDIGLDVDA